MSTELEKATEQMQAGQYKKAVDTLWGRHVRRRRLASSRRNA
jgi:hypothetical protein